MFWKIKHVQLSLPAKESSEGAAVEFVGNPAAVDVHVDRGGHARINAQRRGAASAVDGSQQSRCTVDHVVAIGEELHPGDQLCAID